MNTCNKLASSSSRMSRINTLVSRMLSNPSNERSESSNSSTERPVTSTPAKQGQTNTSGVNPNLKRNLFGVKLNHDQLKTDLNQMWKEQTEIQKIKWNFDFENLKPVNNNNNNELDENNKPSIRYEWKKINFSTSTPQSSSLSDFTLAALTRDEINVLEDEPSEQVPQFYKYQRRFKLVEDKNRINQLNQLTSTPTKEPLDIKEKNPLIEKLIKPKAVKKSSNKLLVDQIITFSENRKDTLRSASTSSATQQVKKLESTSSAFKSKSSDNMKQQSLLDMFKQRKRRLNNANANKQEPNKATKLVQNEQSSSTNENVYKLRSTQLAK